MMTIFCAARGPAAGAGAGQVPKSHPINLESNQAAARTGHAFVSPFTDSENLIL